MKIFQTSKFSDFIRKKAKISKLCEFIKTFYFFNQIKAEIKPLQIFEKI